MKDLRTDKPTWMERLHPMAAIAVVSLPLLYAITLLLPTFDDWTYFTSPQLGRIVPSELLPTSGYWRPLDVLFGHIVGLDPTLFPTLNHIAVYAAHVGCAALVCKLAAMLGYGRGPQCVATLFFFVSPATLGTVLGIDSLNQAYSQLWGLLGLWAYLSRPGKPRRAAWLACVVMATLSKENGIMYLFIPPLLAWGMGRASVAQMRSDMLRGVAVAAAYMAIRMALTTIQSEVNPEYFDNTLASKLKHIATFIGMTWIPLDYVSLLHAPSRNLFLVALTVALPMPFIVYLLAVGRAHLLGRPFATLAACMVLAALPHLLTIFSAMHAYVGLPMSALMVALLADKAPRHGPLPALFAAFLASCAFVDWHHWQKSYESGLLGQRMAREAIEKTGEPVDRAFTISLLGNEHKYSSFCVVPVDAFAWGRAACGATGFTWPKEVADTSISVADRWMVDSIADRAIQLGYQRVWLVHGDTVDVIRAKN